MNFIKKHKNKIAIITLLIALITMITLFVISNLKIDTYKNLSSERLSLLIKTQENESKCNKELTDQKEAMNYVSKIGADLNNLIIRYDNLYIKEHNWVVKNVDFFNTGVYMMDSFLEESKKIQVDYFDIMKTFNNK